jgi:hypothetical protein
MKGREMANAASESLFNEGRLVLLRAGNLTEVESSVYNEISRTAFLASNILYG